MSEIEMSKRAGVWLPVASREHRRWRRAAAEREIDRSRWLALAATIALMSAQALAWVMAGECAREGSMSDAVLIAAVAAAIAELRPSMDRPLPSKLAEQRAELDGWAWR